MPLAGVLFASDGHALRTWLPASYPSPSATSGSRKGANRVLLSSPTRGLLRNSRIVILWAGVGSEDSAMAVKQTGQISFVDAMLPANAGANAQLDRLNGLVKWYRFEKLMRHL